MIQAENLHKAFGNVRAVNGVDVFVPESEISGLLGPNGAGKTTIVNMMCGLSPPDSGQIRIAGHDISTAPVEAKMCLGYVPETPVLYEPLSADVFLDIIGALHGMSQPTSDLRRRELLRLLDLTSKKDDPLRSLSKGMRQKVILAAALLPNPKVLILDEPFDGLDATTIRVMMTVLKDLARRGHTILVSSHILTLMEELCDRVSIIVDGTIVGTGTPTQLCRQSGVGSLHDAFVALTGARPSSDVASEIVAALNSR